MERHFNCPIVSGSRFGLNLQVNLVWTYLTDLSDFQEGERGSLWGIKGKGWGARRGGETRVISVPS